MSHFAQINSDGDVLYVGVWGAITTTEDEQNAIDFFTANVGPGPWIRTWYDAAQRQVPADYRYNFAGVGYSYRENVGATGAFIPPQPFPSWIIDPQTQNWVAPVPLPLDADTVRYTWSEKDLQWKAD